jgi:hypothetical protein
MCAQACSRSNYFKNCTDDSGFVEAEGITFFYKKNKNEDQNIRSFEWTIFERYEDLVNPDHENVLPAKKSTFNYNVVKQRNANPKKGFARLDGGTRCENVEEVNRAHGYMDCETMIPEEYFQQFLQKEKKDMSWISNFFKKK